MSSYFKYTPGNDFILNNSPYSGFFHVLSGIAYSGRKHDTNSQSLTPENKFTTKIYLNREEFDTTYGSIITLAHTNYIHSFDILDKSKFDKFILEIDSNNLYCFKSIITGNPTIFNADKNNYYHYGLSALNEDTPTAPRYSTYPPQTSYPFTNSWGFINNINTGSFVVDTYDNFKYFCADDTNFYILSGNFSNDSNLAVIKSTIFGETIYNIYVDDEKDQLFMVFKDNIKIYNISNFNTCQNLFLIDNISNPHALSAQNIQFVKIGNHFRTELTYTPIIYTESALILKNKYTTETELTISLSKYFDYIYDLAIRSIDDFIIVLGRKGNSISCVMIDPYDLENIKYHTLNDIDHRYIEFKNIALHVMFSTNDSNIFYIYDNDIQHARYISNPTSTSWGRFESLIYTIAGHPERIPDNLKASNTHEDGWEISINLLNDGIVRSCDANGESLLVKYFPISKDIINKKNIPDDFLIYIDGKHYFPITHYLIEFGDGSNDFLNTSWVPVGASTFNVGAGHIYTEGQFTIKISLWNGCTKNFLYQTIEIPINTIRNPHPKNNIFYNEQSDTGFTPFSRFTYDLSYREYSNYGYQYMLVHVFDRLFTFKQPINDKYLNGDSMDLNKQFQYANCSNSSFGLYFDNIMNVILKDTLALYDKFETSFTFSRDSISRKYLDFIPNIGRDLYLNTNETINVIPIKRMTDNIINIEQALLPESNS